jgi:EmrB/QacA subfamily drug resistance transporter
MQRSKILWTFGITSVALLMCVLDNLVVTTALPVIRHDLHATLGQLEWTVNAYTLTYAVFLLSGAALGDRFGRRRMFIIGIALFTGASAASALAPSAGALIAARAVQGLGGAIITPLSLTILSDAVGPENRGMAVGGWSAVAGVAAAAGPVLGGAVIDGISWHWIFWINVPVGLALLPAAAVKLRESYGERAPLDLRGLVLVSLGLLGVVWGVINATKYGWGDSRIVAALTVGGLLVIGFVAWERIAPAPMMPLRLFRSRAFSSANAASLLMYFGTFGSVFLLVQFLQVAQGHSPLSAGLRCLPWTLAPMFIAPVVGMLADRHGGGRFMVAGMALQAVGLAWLALVITATVPLVTMFGALLLCGIGNGFFYAPVANVVLGTVSLPDEGKASGINNMMRELGGVLGIAVLASVFAAHGSMASPTDYVDGLLPALWLGAAALAVAAFVALGIGRGPVAHPQHQPARSAPEIAPEPALALAE